MTLLGRPRRRACTPSRRWTASSRSRSFSFSLDPGTGPIADRGHRRGPAARASRSRPPPATRTESRDLRGPARPQPEPLAPPRRRRASRAGQRLEVSVFDPATLRNAPMALEVGAPRGGVRPRAGPCPPSRCETSFAGITSTSWITDVGEVVREESPMGLVVVQGDAGARPGPGRAGRGPDRHARGGRHRARAAPAHRRPPTRCERLRVRLDRHRGLRPPPTSQGAGQTLDGDVIEIRDARTLEPGPADPERAPLPGPGALHRERRPGDRRRGRAGRGRGRRAPAARAERLVRHVNALLEKKPTVSLPSALRGPAHPGRRLQRAHRPLRRPGPRRWASRPGSRWASSTSTAPSTTTRGPRCTSRTKGRGLWLPVDPTLNQFPADATHIRLGRGGLDRAGRDPRPRRARAKMTIVDLELDAGVDAHPGGRAPPRPPALRDRPAQARRAAAAAAGRGPAR